MVIGEPVLVELEPEVRPPEIGSLKTDVRRSLKPLASEDLDKSQAPGPHGQGVTNIGQRHSTYVGVSKPQGGTYRLGGIVMENPSVERGLA
jgi:hypothetical protein